MKDWLHKQAALLSSKVFFLSHFAGLEVEEVWPKKSLIRKNIRSFVFYPFSLDTTFLEKNG